MRLEDTHITKKIDSLGRIALPATLRKLFEVDAGQEVRVFTLEDDNGKKYLCLTADNEWGISREKLAEMGIETEADTITFTIRD